MIFIKIHIVQPNDTLSTIMKQYNITKQSIEKANPHIANVASLVAGMKVKITSQAKVLHHPFSVPIEHVKSIEQQDIKEDDIKYAPVHNRPFNNSIKYDQKWNTLQYEAFISSDFLAYDFQKRCQHCDKPHYYVTY